MPLWGAVLWIICLFVWSVPVKAQSGGQFWSSSGRARVCMILPGQKNRQNTLRGDMSLMLIVPSGTVFVFVPSKKPILSKSIKQLSTKSSTTTQPITDPSNSGQALVTTETVTLTTGQPCVDADAASLRSHTRNWLNVPVRPTSRGHFLAIGRVRGNGVETNLYSEDDLFRTMVQGGKLQATPENVLGEIIDLQETEADLPTISTDGLAHDPDSQKILQIERDMTSNLPTEEINKGTNKEIKGNINSGKNLQKNSTTTH